MKAFTLLEMLVVVVLVAILAAMAYPSYQNHLIHARRAEGKTALLLMATRLEEQSLQTLGYTATTPIKLIGKDTSEHDYYRLHIDVPDNAHFLLQAAPIGIQTLDECGTLTLNQRGEQMPVACW